MERIVRLILRYAEFREYQHASCRMQLCRLANLETVSLRTSTQNYEEDLPETGRIS